MQVKPIIIKLTAIAVILSISAYVVSTVYLAQLNEGYSHLRHFVSELGKPNMPLHDLLNFSLIAIGLSFWGMAYVLYRILGWSKFTTPGITFLALFAGTIFFEGIFPCEGDCMNPSTLSGFIHGIVGLPAIVFSPLATIYLSKGMRNDGHFRDIWKVCYLLGILTAVAMLLAMTVFPYLDLMGLGQRIGVFFMFIVPIIYSIKLLSYYQYLETKEI